MENQLKVTFFVTLVAGLIGGAFGDWRIPTIAVCAYAVIGWMITREEENIERFADSLYYMGFLFTIWGLLFAFAPWSGNAENLSSKQIITQFGIKLITTVIALTARIILIQVRSSLAEETEETRETLGALAKAMTREIEQSIEEFRGARDRILAQAEEGVMHSHTEAMRRLDSAHADLQRQMQGTLDDARKSMAALVTKVTAIEVPSDILTTPLGEAAKDLATETQRLQTGIREAGAGIAQSLAESMARVRQSAGRIDTAVKGMKGFELLASETDSAATNIAAANAALQATFDQTNRLLGELGGVVSGLQETTSQDIARIRAATKSTADEIYGLGDTIRQDAERYSAALTHSVRLLRGEIERQ